METNQNLIEEEETLNLDELFRAIFSKLTFIILAGLVGALLASFVTRTLVTPTYSSSVKIYVMSQSDSGTITSADVQVGTYLTTDYEEIIQSRAIAEAVIVRLGLTNDDGSMVEYEDLLKRISVSTPDDSRVVSITVSDDDPYEVVDVANAVLEASIEQIMSVMNVETINIVEDASFPTKADSQNTMRNTVYGGLAGALIAFTISIVMYLADDKIRNADDVAHYLGLVTIGTIPMATAQEKKNKIRTNKKRKKFLRVKKSKAAHEWRELDW